MVRVVVPGMPEGARATDLDAPSAETGEELLAGGEPEPEQPEVTPPATPAALAPDQATFEEREAAWNAKIEAERQGRITADAALEQARAEANANAEELQRFRVEADTQRETGLRSEIEQRERAVAAALQDGDQVSIFQAQRALTRSEEALRRIEEDRRLSRYFKPTEVPRAAPPPHRPDFPSEWARVNEISLLEQNRIRVVAERMLESPEGRDRFTKAPGSFLNEARRQAEAQHSTSRGGSSSNADGGGSRATTTHATRTKFRSQDVEWAAKAMGKTTEDYAKMLAADSGGEEDQ
jgi:hypothetical protein